MSGRVFEPFPTQVLIGAAPSGTTYDSPTYDLKDLGAAHWTVQVLASLPGTVSDPARLFLQTSNEFMGPWEDLIPGGAAPLAGSSASGNVAIGGRYLRARVTVAADEVAALRVDVVARSGEG